MPGSPDVTVAVVSWNTRELLARCLASLRPEVEQGRCEVHVVDNASSDGSADLVARRYSWARLHVSGENLGFGRAANLALSDARTPWLAVANADVELQPEAIDRMLETGVADDGVGAVAPRLELPDGTTQHSVYHFPTIPLATVFNSGAHRLLPGVGDRLCLHGHWNPDRPRDVQWAIGAFLLLRAEAFRSVGGFDERQWLYAEDLDLGWRLARAGWRTRYEPRARVTHAESASARQAFGASMSERHAAASYAWMARRRGWSRTRFVAALNLAGAAVRLAGSRALTVFGQARSEQTAALARWVRAHRRGLARRERVLAGADRG